MALKETDYVVIIVRAGIWLYCGPDVDFVEHVAGVNTDLKAIQYLQGWVNNPTIKLIDGNTYRVCTMEKIAIHTDLARPVWQ